MFNTYLIQWRWKFEKLRMQKLRWPSSLWGCVFHLRWREQLDKGSTGNARKNFKIKVRRHFRYKRVCLDLYLVWMPRGHCYSLIFVNISQHYNMKIINMQYIDFLLIYEM